MSKKVVFITGASSGIGKSVALYLTDKGFTVYGTSRNPNKITEKLPFKLVALDVADNKTIQAAIQQVIEAEGQLDIVINNAGVGITGPLEETPDVEIKKAFQTNVFGPLDVIKAALPQMRKQKCGLIINVTSIAGYMGLPYRGVYSATKATLEILTEAFRMEIKDFNIQMTNVAPGDFATNIASGRYHSPVLKNSPYQKPYGDTLKLMDQHVDHGSDPKEMAKAIYKIINTPKPKIHYKVGAFMQKFSIILKCILPDKVYEKMLLNHYKL